MDKLSTSTIEKKKISMVGGQLMGIPVSIFSNPMMSISRFGRIV